MQSSGPGKLSPTTSPAAGDAPVGCPMADMPVRLCQLPAGTEATLHSIDDEQARGLLRSLGVMGTCKLRVCQAGNPCVIQVRSTRIGISMRTAESVCVVPEHPAEPLALRS